MNDSFENTLAAARRAGVDFDDASSPTSCRIESADGPSLNYVDWGGADKPAIVFIHGFLQQARTWDFTCLALRSHFRCISLDLRGHGESGRPAAPDFTTHYYLSDLRRLLAHMRDEMGIARFGLCGLSLGGQLSYLYASENPDAVTAVIVVDVAPELNREARRGVNRYISALPQDGSFDALVDRVTELSPTRSREAVLGSLLRAIRFTDDGRWEWKYDVRLLEHHRVSYTSDELWAALSGVAAPTLFVLGRNSRMVSPDVVRRMVETVPGSSAAYVPNASHRVPGDNPLGFIRAVSPFTERYMVG